MSESLTPGIDVIIVAGGRGSRIGGVDKAQVSVDGERLIDIMLDAVSLLDGLMQVVVVSTRDLQVRPGVKVAGEEPAFSGPLSAVAAGVAELKVEPSAMTAILAVDAPDSPDLIPELVAALAEAPESAAAAVRTDGHLQPLCAVWRTDKLYQQLSQYSDTADQAVKSLYDEVSVTFVEGLGLERDYDTLEQLRERGDVEA
ncbi:molybdenum cofactor guanylyltransferase [Corynebacterium tapiri]|uniref:Molybdenum cofactor guanylyltransferase n=1 Tax=Corynebacterium tapiri TaxID=1448266 RepID=A0A5C4U764_9CORY|nr:NTP transferase domain-containing protein [Corynebacterium tapiri]TNL99725.1 molybdenum cofactor guanylyltransferase [Corynebacterium tapiri]